MSMTVPRSTADCKFNTLENNVVDLNHTKGKPEQSTASAARRKTFPTEDRLLVKFEVCKPRDKNAHSKVYSLLGSRFLLKGLCHWRSLQQQASKSSNHCRNSSSQSTVSAQPKTHERKTLAFVLHEKDAFEEIGSASKDVLNDNESEFADRQVSSMHPSSPLCRKGTSDDMNQKDPGMHVASSSLHYCQSVSEQNDCNQIEGSTEREMESPICLSSFTFSPKNQSLPPFESSKTGLIKHLSSESCISMLSLDYTDDQLSARGCIEPFSSADLYAKEEMTKFSVCFPETRNILGDEASIVEPFFEFGLSGRTCTQTVPNQRVESENMKARNIDFPRRKGLAKGQTVFLNFEKEFQPHAKSKKRTRYERHKVGSPSERTRKAFLNFRKCRGIAGHNEALMYKVLNVGVGIGVSYMLFANWKEFKRLNDLSEKTQSLVQKMQQQTQCNIGSLCGCLSILTMQASKCLQLRRDELHVRVQNADSKAKCAVEPMLGNINMADLEAALEAELALMQQNLGAEQEGSPRDVNEWNAEAQSSNVDDLLEVCDYEETQQQSSADCCALNVQRAVSPTALNKRLHEVLEAQQEKRILQLEAQIKGMETELAMKDKELQYWKDIAHHIMTSHQDKPELTEKCSISDKRVFSLDGCNLKAPQNSLSLMEDDRHNFLVDYPPCEGSKSVSSSIVTSCMSEGLCNNQSSVRADLLENDDLCSTLINPSFEALISGSTLDWPLRDSQTHSTV